MDHARYRHRSRRGRAGRLLIRALTIGAIALGVSAPAQARAAALSAPLARLQARLDALYRAVPRPYLEDEWRPFEDARAEWRRRLARCGDDLCRRANLEEQIARLRYGNGETRRPLAGLPWPHGRFERSVSGEYLSVSIYPLIDDRILVQVSGGAMPTGRWLCNAAAIGTAAGAGPYRLRLIADEPAELLVVPQGATGLSITYTFEHRLVCGLNGAIDGDYRLEPAR